MTNLLAHLFLCDRIAGASQPSVKAVTDGRHHRDTYPNKKRRSTPTNIGHHRRPPTRTKSF